MSLFEALKNVTKEDLDKCIERIKELEAELAGMKAAQRLIETRLGIEHPRLSNFKGRLRMLRLMRIQQLFAGA